MRAHTCPDCGGMTGPVMVEGDLISEEAKAALKKALLDVARNVYNKKDVPEAGSLDIYEGVAGQLTQAIQSGYGLQGAPEYDSPDNVLLSHLRASVHIFSGAKNIDAIKQLGALLTGPDGKARTWPQFRDEVLKLHAEYNVRYLNAEYDHAHASAQMASKWQQFQQNADVMPYGEYVTAGDSRVRPAHARLDHITVPLDDPFWDTCWPPNGWRCRCNVLQESGIGKTIVKGNAAGQLLKGFWTPKDKKIFGTNAGKTGQAFSPGHPYLANTNIDSWKAVDTYGMPTAQDAIDKGKGQPKQYNNDATWENDFAKDMAAYTTGQKNEWAVPAASGEMVTIDQDFIDHVGEAKQMNEERWKLLGNIPDILTQPDEVWWNSTKRNLQQASITYIKYYQGTALLALVSSDMGKTKIWLSTFYGPHGAGSLASERVGALLYKSK